MAIEVMLDDMLPNEMMDIVRELRKQGYVQGVHFDFAYYKPEIRLDEDAYEAVYKRYTVFTFYKEELASWFSLKYT
jgi:hypothetical protein